jgi:hypothetical protein
MDRNIQYLLDKYQTKQPGEQWRLETELEYVREYRHKQRIYLLDGILNDLHKNFIITKPQKDRIIYLLEHLDFSRMGTFTEEQIILMTLVYVKLETVNNARPQHYYNLLNQYDLTMNSLVTYLVKLNKYHISKIPVYY